MVNRSRVLVSVTSLLALLFAGCSSTATVTITTTATPTARPQSPCESLVPGATRFTSVSGVPGLQVPAGTYISAATSSGGGTGQYAVHTYTLCFAGAESAIDGGVLTKNATPTSTIGYLVHGTWTLNDLFPDPSNFSYLDYCSSGHICVNDSGSPDPFTFAGFDHFAAQSGGYTTFRLQVGTIAAPTCSSDPQYYSGTPKYTIYEDGNNASSTDPKYHILMPPGTRNSSFLGGGTAGSSFIYFCSAGTQATVVAFLENSMQNDGYTITNMTASGFNGAFSSPPYTYNIAVSVANTNNYYLRLFAPI